MHGLDYTVFVNSAVAKYDTYTFEFVCDCIEVDDSFTKKDIRNPSCINPRVYVSLLSSVTSDSLVNQKIKKRETLV